MRSRTVRWMEPGFRDAPSQIQKLSDDFVAGEELGDLLGGRYPAHRNRGPEFSPIDLAWTLRMVPSAAFAGSVAPVTLAVPRDRCRLQAPARRPDRKS